MLQADAARPWFQLQVHALAYLGYAFPAAKINRATRVRAVLHVVQ